MGEMERGEIERENREREREIGRDGGINIERERGEGEIGIERLCCHLVLGVLQKLQTDRVAEQLNCCSPQGLTRATLNTGKSIIIWLTVIYKIRQKFVTLLLYIIVQIGS